MILKLLLDTQLIWMIFYKNTEEYSCNQKRKTLIVFDDMIAVMLNNKKLNLVVTELCMTG